MSDPRYQTTCWRKKAKHQLNQHPLCALCARMGRDTAASIADHIEPHRGDPEKFWNGELQSVCASCHSAAKSIQERHGYSQGCDVNGNPLDPCHPWLKEKR